MNLGNLCLDFVDFDLQIPVVMLGGLALLLELLVEGSELVVLAVSVALLDVERYGQDLEWIALVG